MGVACLHGDRDIFPRDIFPQRFLLIFFEFTKKISRSQCISTAGTCLLETLCMRAGFCFIFMAGCIGGFTTTAWFCTDQ